MIRAFRIPRIYSWGEVNTVTSSAVILAGWEKQLGISDLVEKCRNEKKGRAIANLHLVPYKAEDLRFVVYGDCVLEVKPKGEK